MKKIVLLSVLIISLGLFFGSGVKAGTTENVRGWAWSNMDDPLTTADERTIGWISFNSVNCDIDGDLIYEGAGETGGPAPTGCPTSGTVYSYGVNVDLSTTGNFSGHAWIGEESPSGAGPIGWISFNRSETNVPPAPPYNGAETFIAKLDLATNEVSGWARALSACKDNFWNGTQCTSNLAGDKAGGWDGWIKLRSSWGGVSRNTAPNPNELTGYAWSDMVVGWISFNSKNCDANSDGLSDGTPAGCPLLGTAMANYKVIIGAANQAPSAINLSVTNPANYCGFPTPPITLNWTFSDPDVGDTQSAYQVQVDTESSFTVPLTVDSGKVLSSSNSYAPSGLAFGATYYWRVMVWDSTDTPSIWAVGPSFITSLRPPSVNFSCNGQDNCSTISISAGELVTLQDISTLYGGFLSRLWTLPPEATLESGYTTADSPIVVTFTEGQNLPVTLQVTDSNGSCSTTENLNVSSPLPKWKEIAPTGWIEKLFAGLLQILMQIG